MGDVDSTNAVALQRGHESDSGRLWVTAKRQLAGRGRRNRLWVSEPGNLYASLLLVAPQPADRVGLLPLVAGLALHDAIEPLLRKRAQVEVKWPNDILLNGAKCSGILLEAAIRADQTRLIVVGCGVNCGHHPDQTLYPTTSLKAHGVDIGPEDLFDCLAVAMADRMTMWAGRDGKRKIADAFLERAAGLHQPMTVRYSNGEEHGIFAGLDADGYLLLQQDDDIRRILAGDVFFDRPST